MVAFALLFMLVFGADAVLRLAGGMTPDAGEREIAHAYERRLRDLQQQLDHVRSTEAVARARLAETARRLSKRASWLDVATNVAGLGAPSSATLRLRGAEDRQTATDVLASVESSLRRAEQQQLGDVEKLGRRLAIRTRKLAKILKMHGLPVQSEALGGPLIALKGSTGFDERMAAFEAEQAQFEAVRSMVSRLPQGSPVPGRKISSRFGARRDPLNGRQALHGGLDFSAPRGHPVISTGAGTIKFAGRRGGYGKLVEIDHGGGLTTRYGHLSRISVRKGDRIERGAPIGKVGSTGRSTGPHLHYEVRKRGQVRDPAHYVRLARTLKSLM